MFYQNFKFSGLYRGPYCRICPANLAITARILSERYNNVNYSTWPLNQGTKTNFCEISFIKAKKVLLNITLIRENLGRFEV